MGEVMVKNCLDFIKHILVRAPFGSNPVTDVKIPEINYRPRANSPKGVQLSPCFSMNLLALAGISSSSVTDP